VIDELMLQFLGPSFLKIHEGKVMWVAFGLSEMMGVTLWVLNKM